jgi:hypothetical protein
MRFGVPPRYSFSSQRFTFGFAFPRYVLFVAATLLAAASLPSAAQISVDVNERKVARIQFGRTGFRSFLDERLLQFSCQ